MKTLTQNKIYNAPPEQVFKAIDDLSVTGTHMTQSSGMMMGNKLKTGILDQTSYRAWHKIQVDRKNDVYVHGFYR